MINKEKESLFTDKELAEAHIFPSNLSTTERQEIDAEMKTLRFQRLAAMSDSEKLQGNLLGLKFQMEDSIQLNTYSEKNNFSTYLQAYLKILNKKQVDFATEIGLHPTKLNQILNNKTMPNIPLMYRLEKHSGGFISALLWWKLLTKKMESDIVNDTKKRQFEANKVSFELAF
jgi:transcriptional regulator with XRE-family HTH domain